MSVTEIPATKQWRCDVCAKSETDKHRPKHWADLTVAQDAYDYQGSAVADGTIKRLLCDDCRTAIVAAINEAAKKQTQP